MAKTSATRAAEAAARAADAAARAAQAATDDSDDTPSTTAPDVGPLFSLPTEDAERIHVRTRILREEPIDEGDIGDVSPAADRRQIRNRWGGGLYNAQAIDQKGKIITQAQIKLSGDPIFHDETGRKRYAQWKKQQFSDDPPAAKSERTLEDTIALEDARHSRELARIKADSEAAVAKAKAEAEVTLARAKAETEARRAEEEARRQRDREDEDRRVKRDQAFAEEQRKRDREWMTMILGQKQQGDPMAMATEVVKLAAALRGGGGDGEYPDPVTAAMARLPETIEAVRNVAGDVVASNATKGDGSYNPDKDVLLEGELARRAKRMISSLKRQGKNEAEIGGIMASAFDVLSKARRVGPKKTEPKRKAPAPKKAAASKR